MTLDSAAPNKDCWMCQGKGNVIPKPGDPVVVVHFRGDCGFPLVMFWDADGRNRLWLEGKYVGREEQE